MREGFGNKACNASKHIGYYKYTTLFNITYFRHYSMEHCPSWEANRFSASQEILLI
jgi:hypothetical protein